MHLLQISCFRVVLSQTILGLIKFIEKNIRLLMFVKPNRYIIVKRYIVINLMILILYHNFW